MSRKKIISPEICQKYNQSKVWHTVFNVKFSRALHLVYKYLKSTFKYFSISNVYMKRNTNLKGDSRSSRNWISSLT